MTGAREERKKIPGRRSGCWWIQWFDSGSGSSETGWDPVQVLLHHRGRGSLEATTGAAQCSLLLLLLLNAGSLWALSSPWLMSLLCKMGSAAWCTELSRLQTQESRKKWDEGQGKQPKGNIGRWKGRLRSSRGQAHVVIFFFCTLLYCFMSMTQ